MEQEDLKKLKKALKKQQKALKNSKLPGEFKKFILRGNVLDLAVGVIIGGAFQKIVSSVVNDMFMPVVSLATKLIMSQGIDFTNWFLTLDGDHYKTLTEAQKAGAIIVPYGNLISGLVDFFIMAIVIFMLVKGINKLSELGKKEEEAPETEKRCPYCMTKIHIEASRCPHCTSILEEEKEVWRSEASRS